MPDTVPGVGDRVVNKIEKSLYSHRAYTVVWKTDNKSKK